MSLLSGKLRTAWAMYDLAAKYHTRTKTDYSRAQPVMPTVPPLRFFNVLLEFLKMSIRSMIYLFVLIQTNAFNSICA